MKDWASVSEIGKKYNPSLDHFDGAVILTDEMGRILEVSHKTPSVVGYEGAVLSEMRLQDLVHREDLDRWREFYDFLKAKRYAVGEIRLHREDGSDSQVECSAVAIEDSKFQFILRDLKQQKSRLGKLQRLNREAIALYEIGRQINSSFDVDEVLTLIVKNSFWLLECHFAGAVLYDAFTDTVSYRAVVGSKEDRLRGAIYNGGEDIVGRAIRSNSPCVVQTCSSNSTFDPTLSHLVAAEGLVSALSVPLSYKNKKEGAMILGFRTEHSFSEEEIRLVSNIANQAGLALENLRLYRASIEHSSGLEALSSRLTQIQEEERRRIALDLHENVGQALTGIRLNLELLCREVPITEPPAMQRVTNLKKLLDETLNKIRQMVFELRPTVLDDFGLYPALRLYVDCFTKQTNIHVDLKIPDDARRFPPFVEATLYRVIQEALANVAKHSEAREVALRLEAGQESLDLEIADDGKGFSPTNLSVPGRRNRAMGILSMRERISGLSGRFALTTAPGSGTRIRIQIPTTSVL